MGDEERRGQEPPAGPEVPYLELVRPWRRGRESELLETPIFTVRRRRARSPTRRDHGGDFVVLDTPDWINVIALTPAREVVLIEQYRHGTDEVTLEIPGGQVDSGEEPLAAGLRELREESGYVGDESRLIGVVSPNPAFHDNRCHTALVTGAARRDRPRLDTHEEIAVRLAPLTDVPGLIADGLIHHALVVAAFHHLWLVEGGIDAADGAEERGR